MKVKNQFIVIDNFGYTQLLFELENGQWYLTSTGAFGQREMHFDLIGKKEAEKLIKKVER